MFVSLAETQHQGQAVREIELAEEPEAREKGVTGTPTASLRYTNSLIRLPFSPFIRKERRRKKKDEVLYPEVSFFLPIAGCQISQRILLFVFFLPPSSFSSQF